ncbi:hypothetical protein HanPSC8_Chr09g0397041 [Helianthus annuus]|nr:hypothetical protein HanPSC8_Chr09g0397041 [Helianthus annuus]
MPSNSFAGRIHSLKLESWLSPSKSSQDMHKRFDLPKQQNIIVCHPLLCQEDKKMILKKNNKI